MTRVLIVEEEAGLRRALAINLRAHGYTADVAADGAAALQGAAHHPPDAVVLDLGLPDIDGVEVIEGLRGWSRAPILVLSARAGEHDKVLALDAGADDYVTKPYNAPELLARIRAALRRTPWTQGLSGRVKIGSAEIDFDTRRVTARGRDVRLTPKEFELLRYLMAHANKVVPHRELLQAVWGPDYGDQVDYLRVFVNQLRKKIETNPSSPTYLITEPWVGYRLQLPAEQR